MSLARVILAVLIGVSLAITPVAAAMAGPAASMAHCDKAGKGDGSCCDKANACRPDACAAKCFKIPGVLADADFARRLRARDFEPSVASLTPLSAWPPPAPPPRT